MRINGRDGGAAIRAANLYSKVAGGQIEFYALLSNDASSSVKNGQLVLRNFEVRNEAALAELDSRGKPKKSGPRRESLSFAKLTLPFHLRRSNSSASATASCAATNWAPAPRA